MNIALKELLRQPRRFVPVGAALTLLVVLLAVLGGFLDGLELSQTGAYRAHDGDLLVFSADADRQIQRSAVTAADAEAVGALDGVAAVGGLDRTFSVVRPDGGELTDVVLFGYDLGTRVLPDPPPDGEIVVDTQLGREAGVGEGDVVELGATGAAVTVAASVDDVTQAAATVWVSSDAWRALVGAVNPAGLPPEGGHQVLVVRLADGADAAAVQASIGELRLDAVTVDEAIAALDVVQQQSSTFSGIIGVTFIVTLLVVALFFALLTLERVDLYAVLKALGAGTGELLRGVTLQAVGVSLVAVVAGLALSWLFVAVLPPELPVRLEPTRVVQIALGTILTAVVGSLFTARRLLRVDPAESIG